MLLITKNEYSLFEKVHGDSRPEDFADEEYFERKKQYLLNTRSVTNEDIPY